MPEYTISLLWDCEAAVWVATSDDIPGLVLESGSLDALIERIKLAVPELIRLAGIIPIGVSSFSLRLKSERRELVSL